MNKVITFFALLTLTVASTSQAGQLSAVTDNIWTKDPSNHTVSLTDPADQVAINHSLILGNTSDSQNNKITFITGSDVTSWKMTANSKTGFFGFFNTELSYQNGDKPVFGLAVTPVPGQLNYSGRLGIGTSTPRGKIGIETSGNIEDASITLDVDGTDYSTPNPIATYSRWSIISRKGKVSDGNGKLGYLDFAFGDTNKVALSLRPTEAGKVIANLEGVMRLAPLTSSNRSVCKTVYDSDQKPLDPNPYEGKIYYDNDLNQPVFCGGKKEAVCWRTLDGKAVAGQENSACYERYVPPGPLTSK